MKTHPWRGKKAIITGASSGIGANCALLLARKNIHTIIVARRLDKLQDLSEKITSIGGVSTIFQADLLEESERDELFHFVNHENLAPDILINNAGLGWYGYYSEMPWDIARDLITLNVTAVAHLTKLFLPGMLERDFGRIINIGSIAGKLPEQGIALYSASKAFMDAFTTSIYRDIRHTNVSISVLRAGPVKTEFYKSARNLPNGRNVPAEKLAVSPNVISKSIWKLIQKPRRFAYSPFYTSVSPLLETFFSGIIDLVGPLLLRAKKSTPKSIDT